MKALFQRIAHSRSRRHEYLKTCVESRLGSAELTDTWGKIVPKSYF